MPAPVAGRHADDRRSTCLESTRLRREDAAHVAPRRWPERADDARDGGGDVVAIVGLDLLGADAASHLDSALQARGYRLLHKIPRLPESVADNVVARFASLQKIMRAGLADLTEVEGVGETRARAIKEGLSMLAETSILERYV